MEKKVLMPGEVAGNYNEKWTKTFDLQFLILWLVLFALLLVWTIVADPHLFDAHKFFLLTGVKLFVMMMLALGGGLLCRNYCHVDQNEPVGTYLGKKKYVVPSWNMKHRYVRSYAGSACVYICALLFLVLYRGQFANPQEFWTAMVVFPPVMTLAEAFSPHSMDTPIMMLIGFSLLFGICTVF